MNGGKNSKNTHLNVSNTTLNFIGKVGSNSYCEWLTSYEDKSLIRGGLKGHPLAISCLHLQTSHLISINNPKK